MTGRARLILADDHHLLVESLRSSLSKRYDVVATAYDGETLLALLPSTIADCLLLDLGLPGRGGLDVIPEIRATWPGLRILVVTMHLDRTLADAALHAGADGFIPKDSGMEELEGAIEAVLAGRRYLSPRIPPVTNRLGLAAAHPGLAELTPRQQEVLRLIGDGKSTAEIAQITRLSPRTVAFHRTNIRQVLGIESEQGLVRQAVLFRVAEAEREEHDRETR